MSFPHCNFSNRFIVFETPMVAHLKNIPLIVTLKKAAINMKINIFSNLDFTPNSFSRTFYAGPTACFVLESILIAWKRRNQTDHKIWSNDHKLQLYIIHAKATVYKIGHYSSWNPVTYVRMVFVGVVLMGL